MCEMQAPYGMLPQGRIMNQTRRRWQPSRIHTPLALSRLISLLNWLLAIHFALILPFVCWGSWAEPGHPHSHPHFVFVVPEMAADIVSSATGTVTAVQTDHAHHGASHESKPVGPARPDLATSILVLVLITTFSTSLFRPQREMRCVAPLLARLPYSPYVSTPPPRSATA